MFFRIILSSPSMHIILSCMSDCLKHEEWHVFFCRHAVKAWKGLQSRRWHGQTLTLSSFDAEGFEIQSQLPGYTLVRKVTSRTGNGSPQSLLLLLLLLLLLPVLLFLILILPPSWTQFTEKVLQELIIDWSHSVFVESRICKYAFLLWATSWLLARAGANERRRGEARSAWQRGPAVCTVLTWV